MGIIPQPRKSQVSGLLAGDGGRESWPLPNKMCLGSWSPTWESEDETPLHTHRNMCSQLTAEASPRLAPHPPTLTQGQEEAASLQEAL